MSSRQKSTSCKALIAGLLFLAIQFVSMFGGVHFIASAQDFDNVDDMSLEDVVPLDPFLDGPQVGNLVGLSSPAKAIFALLYLFLPRPDEAASENRWVAASRLDSRGHNLWLVNRVLLI